ncbi:SGNH/GDSL hydrolase family protein [Paenibacillus sp. NPDC056579]|uniref:SGNH/GDSL hydrolase family protein n=1 Tax=Paenibacillus sp. NPDC056579 TaxID=3345871 RepID=UPI0036C3A09B
MRGKKSFGRLHHRLKQKAQDPYARPVIYVAFGDSVTQGCMEYGVIDHDAVYHQDLKRRIERRYPGTTLSVINSGASGDNAHRSRERWQRDLISFQPDLVTVAFGINDCHQGNAGLKAYLQAMEDLTGLIRRETEADLLVMTPTNMLMLHPNPNIDPRDEAYISGFQNTANQRYLHIYAEALRMWIRENRLPHADIFALWEQMETQGIDIHFRLSNGLNHPDRVFHQQLAEELENVIFDSIDLT